MKTNINKNVKYKDNIDENYKLCLSIIIIMLCFWDVLLMDSTDFLGRSCTWYKHIGLWVVFPWTIIVFLLLAVTLFLSSFQILSYFCHSNILLFCIGSTALSFINICSNIWLCNSYFRTIVSSFLSCEINHWFLILSSCCNKFQIVFHRNYINQV